MNEVPQLPVSTDTADRYTWGNGCDGWHLLRSDALSIIQERMPPGTSEVMHYHQTSRQFFFILSGEATIAFAQQTVVLTAHTGIEIPPLVAHQMQNNSPDDLIFTVTSMPTAHGDRVTIP